MIVCPQSALWLLVHCSSLLRRGRYASYWNAFLFKSNERSWQVFPRVLQDVPYLDLSSHMRPRASSFRREVSDDQLSLCSMDSSMSQSSSMNTEGGHSALGELMETSSRSSSFEEQTTEPTTSTSSFAGTILVL